MSRVPRSGEGAGTLHARTAQDLAQRGIATASDKASLLLAVALICDRERSSPGSDIDTLASGLMSSVTAATRFEALCCLGFSTPTEVVDLLVVTGLVDRSSRVRWRAAGCALDLLRHSLVPAIENALLREKNVAARANMEIDLALLRDGHILKPYPNGDFELTVSVGPRGAFASIRVTESELRTTGVEALAAEIRRTSFLNPSAGKRLN